MRLISLNVSLPRTVAGPKGPVETGIFKEPVEGRVAVRKLNIDGDGQADLRFHGGADKAVYAYPVEHYAFWKTELQRERMPFGLFGENLTVEGMLERNVCIGDTFRAGTAVVQVTQPRVPCFKLGIKMGDAAFVKRFLRSRRSGFYLRVVEEGDVAAGDAIELIEADPHGLSVHDVHIIHFSDTDAIDVDGIRRALSVPALSGEWRTELDEILARHQ
ncbi:MAG: MOSC domain-containing protein [Candidatus Hydrogenedentes bacterium]|nr:MOSC domain-containing protein [Candidatus Hydrogenedentota bacterium]